MTIGVIGAGSWGTALAHTLAAGGREVVLWSRRPELANSMRKTRINPAYLPGVEIHPRVRITSELSGALAGSGTVILAIPTHGMRDVITGCSGLLAGATVAVVSAAKGFEIATGMTMTEVIADVLGRRWHSRIAVLSGPNIAPEIARGLPAATVVASSDATTAARVRDACSGSQLRFYSSTDVVGVEYGGGLKNVVAIAAGVCDGIGVGDNGKAAVITRGIAEMARLGTHAGASPLTFAGLTGLGDCIVTCTSPQSRNRRLGEAIGRGETLVEALRDSVMVAEGVNAARAAVSLAARHGVDMPIATEVSAVLFDGKSVATAIGDLMSRGAGDELRGFGLEYWGTAPASADI